MLGRRCILLVLLAATVVKAPPPGPRPRDFFRNPAVADAAAANAAAAAQQQQQAAADDISAALQAAVDGGADLLKAADVVTDTPPVQQAVSQPTVKPAAGPPPPTPQTPKPAATPPAPQPTPSPTKRVMVGPAVPADWRDKDALATVTATLTFDAPRIGPFNGATRDALRKAVEATVGSEASINVRRVDSSGPAVPVGTPESPTDRQTATVVFDVPMRALTPALARMQTASDNSELAGQLRARGLYDVTDARFVKYGLAWGGVAVPEDAAPAPAPSPSSVVDFPPLPKPSNGPVPVPTPKATPPPPPPPPAPTPPPPLSVGVDVGGAGGDAALTQEHQDAVKRAVAKLAGVEFDQVKVAPAQGGGRRRLQQSPPSTTGDWSQKLAITVAPGPNQGAAVRAALDKLATDEGAARLADAVRAEGWPSVQRARVATINGAAPGTVAGGEPASTSSNLSGGAIAGIVIGALAAAALLAALIAGLVIKHRRGPPPTGAPANAPKLTAAASAQTDMESVELGSTKATPSPPPKRGFAGLGRPRAPPPPPPALGTDGVADGARKDLASIAAAGVSSLRRLASGAAGRLSATGGRESSTTTTSPPRPPRAPGAPPDALDLVEDTIADLALRGTPFAGKYAADAVVRRGARTVEVSAREIAPPRRAVLLKFFTSADEFRHEGALAAKLPPGDATPAVLDAYAAGGAPGAAALPACVVSEAGDYSLADWPRKRSRTPDDVQRRAVLAMVAKAVAALHARGVVHGGLCPDAVLWCSGANAMRLGRLGTWAPVGGAAPPPPDARYAAPEVATAVAKGAATVPATVAADNWALGALAYWIFTDAPLLPNAGDAGAAAAALGEGGPLPWEARPAALAKLAPPVAAVITGLLARDPAARMAAADVLTSPLFRSRSRRPGSGKAASAASAVTK